jgi:hypothetical protein
VFEGLPDRMSANGDRSRHTADMLMVTLMRTIAVGLLANQVMSPYSNTLELVANYVTLAQFISIRLWLGVNESTPYSSI